MNASRGVVAALATLVAVGAFAGEPHTGPLKSWTLPDYTVISHDESQALAVTTAVATVDRVLSALLSPPPKNGGVPTRIYVVRSDVWARYLRPSAAMIAEFVPTRFANYLLINGGNSRQGLREAAFHECTHLFLRTHYRGELPLWFDEGIAELMDKSKISGAVATVGTPPNGVYLDSWISLDRLLRIDKTSPEYLSPLLTGAVHYQSWALVHQGLIAEPAFGKQMNAYLQAVNDLHPIEDAIEASFDMNLAKLSAKTAAYRGRRRFYAATLAFEPPPPANMGEARTLGKSEAYESLARVMMDTGFNVERVNELVSAAEKHDPDSTGVAILRLRIAARAYDSSATERLFLSLQPRTADASLAREVGLALFERARENEPGAAACDAGQRINCDRSFDLLDRALDANASDAEAAWAFGMLAAGLGRDLNSALQRLQHVSKAVPMHADIAMAMALVYEARGDSALMIQQLVDTVRFSSSRRQKLWARRRIDEATLALKESASR